LFLPKSLGDYVIEDTPVRIVEVFIDGLNLGALGFDGVQPASTVRPTYWPSTLLKIYLYGDLNRVRSSRRLKRDPPCRPNQWSQRPLSDDHARPLARIFNDGSAGEVT